MITAYTETSKEATDLRALLLAYLKPCLVFFFGWVIHMRSASFCLVKGQETQLSSKQEVKIAEHIFTAEHIKTRDSLSFVTGTTSAQKRKVSCRQAGGRTAPQREGKCQV